MKIRVQGKLLKISYRPFNSGGKGGQHSNKTLNAVEASVELPDGRVLKATSKTSKSQHTNKKLAEQSLVLRILAAYKRVKLRGKDGERIRTYHAVRNDVVDHASGLHRSFRGVMSGDGFGELVDARREAMVLRAACAVSP